MEIAQFDIKTAFLNDHVKEEIYMYIPEGVSVPSNGKVCRLRKSIYGLKQSSRAWNRKFDEFLKCFCFQQSNADPCLYIGRIESNKVYLIIYVDDSLVLAPSKEIINKILKELKLNFEITIGDGNYYIGIEIIRLESKSIFIHQTSYAERILSRFNMSDAKIKETPTDLGMCLTPSENIEQSIANIPYRQVIGSLFLANIPR